MNIFVRTFAHFSRILDRYVKSYFSGPLIYSLFPQIRRKENQKLPVKQIRNHLPFCWSPWYQEFQVVECHMSTCHHLHQVKCHRKSLVVEDISTENLSADSPIHIFCKELELYAMRHSLSGLATWQLSAKHQVFFDFLSFSEPNRKGKPLAWIPQELVYNIVILTMVNVIFNSFL